MLVQAIESLDDPRVADYRNIRDGDLVRRAGLFMAEGRGVVRCLVEQSPLVTRSVFATPAAVRALEVSLGALDRCPPVYVAENALFNEIAGVAMHRGCLATGERRERGWDACLAPASVESLVVVLEELTDTDNVGSTFRNAKAFGADAILLCPRTCDPLYRKAIRTSMGASLCVPFGRADAWPDPLEALREAGYSLVALDPAPDAVELTDWVGSEGLPRRIAFLLGTEGGGLSGASLALVDHRVRVGMTPGMDSINVATAAAIALHAIYARRQASVPGCGG